MNENTPDQQAYISYWEDYERRWGKGPLPKTKEDAHKKIEEIFPTKHE